MFSETASPSTFSGVADSQAITAVQSTPALLSRQRLASIDALRGFTMLWLIGWREFVLALATLFLPAYYADAIDTQLTHPKWQGFVAWDMVMPVFLFVVGVSMPFAMAKRRQAGCPTKTEYWRIARRVAALWVLGMVNQVSKPEADGPELFSNTLQAIAIGYLVTSVALLHFRLRGQIGLFAALTIIYGALLLFVPFPDHPGGTLQRTANLPRYIDEVMLGVFRRDHSYTWVLTSLGFSASVLLGSLAGRILRWDGSARQKLVRLCLAGLACMAAGWAWSYVLPFNRHLWTSSMILWSGGISFLLLALFYLVIDVGGYKRWTFPLVVIGANALLAYILDPLFDQTSRLLASSMFPNGEHWPLEILASAIELTCLWLVLWMLYRKRLFLRA
jgi:predicted acyltransferase